MKLLSGRALLALAAMLFAGVGTAWADFPRSGRKGFRGKATVVEVVAPGTAVCEMHYEGNTFERRTITLPAAPGINFERTRAEFPAGTTITVAGPSALQPVAAEAPKKAVPKAPATYAAAHAGLTAESPTCYFAVGQEHRLHAERLQAADGGCASVAAVAACTEFRTPGVYILTRESNGRKSVVGPVAPWWNGASAAASIVAPSSTPLVPTFAAAPVTMPAPGGGGPLRKAGRFVKRCFGTHCEMVWVED